MRVVDVVKKVNGSTQETILHNAHAYVRITIDGSLVRWEKISPSGFVDEEEMELVESIYRGH